MPFIYKKFFIQFKILQTMKCAVERCVFFLVLSRAIRKCKLMNENVIMSGISFFNGAPTTNGFCCEAEN